MLRKTSANSVISDSDLEKLVREIVMIALHDDDDGVEKEFLLKVILILIPYLASPINPNEG